MKRQALCILFVIACLPAAGVLAQTLTLPEIRSAYRGLQLDVAEEALRSIIAAPGEHSVGELTESHLLLGVILHVRYRNNEARTQFLAALQLNPRARPNSLDTSPKTMDFFDSVLDAFNQLPSSNGSEPQVTYIRVEDVRPAAAMRSMLVPGWGQFYRGDSRKGWAVGSAWAVSVGSLGVTHIARQRAKSEYEEETNPDLVSEKYDAFNSWNRRRSVAAIATGLVWLYAYVDALSTRGNAEVQLGSNVTLAYGSNGSLAALRVQIR